MSPQDQIRAILNKPPRPDAIDTVQRPGSSGRLLRCRQKFNGGKCNEQTIHDPQPAQAILLGATMAQRIYIVKQGETKRLVRAASQAVARSHVAKSTISVEVAKPG